MASNTPAVDFDHPNERWHRRQLARAVNDILNGHINSVVDYDFDTAGGALLDERITPDSIISFIPLNAIAAANPAFVDGATITAGSALVTGGAAGALFRVSILG